jgi:type I site-specific restriction endonuclease
VKWFKDTPDAILTSVGILTTGFDEPTVETIILNRATRSLTLYHQMIGRGSRRLPNKSEFKIIDLGNNVRRFGYWQDYINWHDAFRFPDRFLESRISELEDLQFEVEYEFPRHFNEIFNVEKLQAFSIADAYYHAIDNGNKGRVAIDESMENHAEVIIESTKDIDEAIKLVNFLQDHIEHRLKHYSKCISKCTPNYIKYLIETYNRQLTQKLRIEIDTD